MPGPFYDKLPSEEELFAAADRRARRVTVVDLIGLALVLVAVIATCFMVTPAHASGFDVMEMTCALGVPIQECSPLHGAVDVSKIGEADLPIDCLRWGMLSGTAAPTADMNSYYHKIMCVRR